MGIFAGLQRRIRHASPFILYINCRKHRLALFCPNDEEKSASDYATLIAIWKMFHFSPKKAATFKNMQKVYGQRPLAFVHASTTRNITADLFFFQNSTKHNGICFFIIIVIKHS